MANPTKNDSPESNVNRQNVGYFLRTQKFLSGATMVACSCGEVRVFPGARRDGKCPRGNPWVCMAQQGLPLVSLALEDSDSVK